MPDTAELLDKAGHGRLVPQLLSKEDAALRRRLSRRRRLDLPVDGRRLGFTFSLPVDPLPGPDGIAASAAIGATRVRLHVPQPLIDWAILVAAQALAPPGRLLDPHQSLLLVDLVFTPVIEALETAFGVPIGPLEPLAGQKPDVALGLAVDVQTPDGPRGQLRLGLPAALAERAAALIEQAPALTIEFGALPVPLSVRIGEVSLSLAELRALQPGDIILHDPVSADPSLRLVALSERWIASARAETGRVRLTTAFHAAFPSPEFASMSEFEPRAASLTGPHAAADIDLDQLPVRLVFETGRTEIPLRELRSLGVGHVFELGRDAANPIDILANGKRIGAGELVRIGDEIGIRVRQIFGHG